MPSERLYLKDSDKVFDIELQNAIDFDLPFRTRYYQSMIDTDNFLKVNIIQNFQKVLSFLFALTTLSEKIYQVTVLKIVVLKI